MMSEPSLAFPAARDRRRTSPPTTGERSVACFEAAKGILVILAGFGVLSLMHHDLQHFARAFVDHLHLNPAGRSSHIFLALGTMSGQELWLLAAMSCAYSTLRLAEAYGLWTGKRWAKWFAAASGGLYVPLEAWELLRGINWMKVTAFIINVGIVIYMIYALRRDQRAVSGPAG